jgi:LPXTG-motif cell wall-anchored protein
MGLNRVNLGNSIDAVDRSTNDDMFIGGLVQGLFTTPEGRARRQERKDMKVQGTYAEKMGLAQALSGGGQEGGSDNTMMYVIIGILALLLIGGGLFFALKK